MPFINLKKQYELLQADIDRAVNTAVSATKYINGPEVGQLEGELAEYVGAGHCVTCANGTDALTLVLLAWGIGPGDAVFCPTFTFIATAEVVALRGATPIFVDIDPITYNIDPADLEEKIVAVKAEGKLRPKVIIPVDLFGLPFDYERVAKIADDYKLLILEDAAQGFGGVYGGKKAGTLGSAGATSFFPAKPLGCYGDGGAIFTDDANLAEVLRSLRSHGSGAEKYTHLRLGMNSRLDTIQAAILLVKLAAFPNELDLRQNVAERYERALVGVLPFVPAVPGGRLSSWAQYTIRVPADLRSATIESLKAAGVPTMIYYPGCLHLQPAFAQFGGRPGDLKKAELASNEVLSLPMHPYLTADEQKRVTDALLEGLASAASAAG
ncbi:MAG: DegT/DnrJ/EryC1/StrS family aminotransferase [Deltaproteobacteria bacterium]|nr:DegT/DnrJ/EryC1/StrS family aminotransferase [Deltaproteobacteria bacterium]